MHTETFIAGKDAALETSIATMQHKLAQLGFHIEERSWLNPVAGIWSVHLRDRDCPLLFTNGKGASKLACLASALGEFFERLSTRYFWTHYYLGAEIAGREFVHDPRERWFPLPKNGKWPKGLLTPELQAFYNPEGNIAAESLVDLNSGHASRGICALPYIRQRDGATVWFPVNIIGNLYMSNGMSAGNTPTEAHTQALSEIFERHVKFRIIAEGLCLPDVPADVIARHPNIAAGINELRKAGFGILVKDASLGGQFPVMNVTLLNPRDQGCYVSFCAHPRFDVALERAHRAPAGPRAGRARRFSTAGFRSRRSRQRAESRNPFRRLERQRALELPRRHSRLCGLRLRRLELQHAGRRHRPRLRLADRTHPRAGPRCLHRRFHPSRRLCLPRPRPRHVGNLSGRRSRMGEQQQRQCAAPRHPELVGTRR
jgi:YcaO-like protein with predicted kinase domain